MLAVKRKQGRLYADLQGWFAWADQQRFQGIVHSYAQTVNKNHGRIEMRRCWALSDPQAFAVIRHYGGWAGL
ncbi:MAG: hypothetical protein CV045_13655 [Cyanobacteria bacterium M5B4]|nr:MAG: hypothetical protein CV045_13655 [Cyanobacteria bacterium M5B4]